MDCDPTGFSGCFYNEEITDLVHEKNGGTITITATSNSFNPFSATCPKPKTLMYVKYYLSYYPDAVLTPSPTAAPTAAAVATGSLRVDLISAGETGWLLSFLAVLLGTFGIYCASLRVKTPIYPMKLLYAGFRMAQVATELSSLGFLLVTILGSDLKEYGYLILTGRFIHVFSAFYLYVIIFGPKWITDQYPYTKMLERQHMAEYSYVYGIISLLGFIDTSYFFFYPWLDSAFCRCSFGYPDLHTFRICEYSILVTAATTLIFQIEYLNHSKVSSNMEKLFFEVNIALQVLKIFLSTFGFLIMGDPNASIAALKKVEEAHSKNPMQVEEGTANTMSPGSAGDASKVESDLVNSLRSQINSLQQDASIQAKSDAMMLTMKAMIEAEVNAKISANANEKSGNEKNLDADRQNENSSEGIGWGYGDAILMESLQRRSTVKMESFQRRSTIKQNGNSNPILMESLPRRSTIKESGNSDPIPMESLPRRSTIKESGNSDPIPMESLPRRSTIKESGGDRTHEIRLQRDTMRSSLGIGSSDIAFDEL